MSTKIARNIRYLSGPVTGKTTELMREVDRQLKSGISPSQILFVSFTRTTVNDLKKAIDEQKDENIRLVNVRTYHSLSFSILQRAGAIVASGRVPRILEGWERDFLLEDLSLQLAKGKRWTLKKIRQFEADWATLQSDQPGWPPTSEDREFERALMSWLYFHRGMLLGELVPLARRFLSNNPLGRRDHHYQVLIVDEYQDLNKADQSLIDLIANGEPLVVAGDPDQSIYHFRHANPDGIIEFPDNHKPTKTERLTICWRCPQDVVSIARSLISNNPRLDQEYFLQANPENSKGDIRLVQWESLKDEAEGIIHYLKWLAAKGVPYNEVLVLVPRKELGKVIREAAMNAEINCVTSFGEGPFAGSTQAKQLFCVLCLLKDPWDAVALRAWLGIGDNAIDSKAYLQLWQRARDERKDLWTTLVDLRSGRLAPIQDCDPLPRFERIYSTLTKCQGQQGENLGELLLTQSPEGGDYCEEIEKIIRDSMAEKGHNLSAEDILDNVKVGDETRQQTPTDKNTFRILTYPKAKGLTDRAVVVAGCIAGWVPTFDSGAPPEEQRAQIQEARRLFYVALTRTTEYLLISMSRRLPASLANTTRAIFKKPNKYSKDAIATSSIFLQELGHRQPEVLSGESFLQGLNN